MIREVLHVLWLVSSSTLEDRRMDNVTIDKFLLFHNIKEIDSMLLWVCTEIDYGWRQNAVRTHKKHSVIPMFS